MKANVNQLVKFGSYDKEDVIFLLKDLSDVTLEGSTEEREKRFKVESIIVKRCQSNIIHQNIICNFFGRRSMLIKTK